MNISTDMYVLSHFMIVLKVTLALSDTMKKHRSNLRYPELSHTGEEIFWQWSDVIFVESSAKISQQN